MDHQPNNPLHGVTLNALLELLVERHGWAMLAKQINIKCFKSDPSINSSLTFLRRHPWARERVEQIYLYDLRRGRAAVRPKSGTPASGLTMGREQM